MAQITVPVFIQAKHSDKWETPNHGEYLLEAFSYEASRIGDSKRIDVVALSITFDVPEDWNPIPQQIAALEAKRTELLADTQVKINFINDTISKLQCLTLEAL